MKDVIVKTLRRRANRFMARQEGAVTVDWVVLTALVVSLAAAALSGVEGGVAALTAKLASYLLGLVV